MLVNFSFQFGIEWAYHNFLDFGGHNGGDDLFDLLHNLLDSGSSDRGGRLDSNSWHGEFFSRRRGGGQRGRNLIPRLLLQICLVKF